MSVVIPLLEAKVSTRVAAAELSVKNHAQYVVDDETAMPLLRRSPVAVVVNENAGCPRRVPLAPLAVMLPDVAQLATPLVRSSVRVISCVRAGSIR